MFKYRATLRSGAVVTRKSDRIYTHYWRVVGNNNSAGGFAGSEALAKKAARLYSSYFPAEPQAHAPSGGSFFGNFRSGGRA
jgi:hypothetical protein